MSGCTSQPHAWPLTLGARVAADGRTQFCVWAPYHEALAIQLEGREGRAGAMERDAQGYHRVTLSAAPPGTRYWLRLPDGSLRVDPASRSQPEGVHGPSQVVAPGFAWSDGAWSGLALPDYLLYELHVGTFTPEGTFDAVIPQLDALRDLGITALEIMPVGQFPGSRGWGYDGVNLFAVQNSYGGPEGLKRLVNACHQRGLAVVLDVVYNHLGPEGNYLAQYGPYFTDRYQTPWGDAVNLDGPQSDHVRRFFIENALMWVTEYHVDGLRLDATHALYDFSARTFLEELVAVVHDEAARLNRRVILIAENDRGDDRLLRPIEEGGYGLDAQWSDDLHHVLHTLLTRESFGYYADYGEFAQLVKALRQGFVYAGEYSPFRGRRHGTFQADLPGCRFVVCSQNHDQVGNRMNGERLSALVPFEALKLAAAVVLLSPYLPLLFMGEEYGEPAPFLYFTGFEDPNLGAAVSEGRRAEFKDYQWEGDAPDPQDFATFERSKLNQSLRDAGCHARLQAFYAELIRLRGTLPALRQLEKTRQEVVGFERERVIYLHRWQDGNDVAAVFNLNDAPVTLTLPFPSGPWEPVLYSVEARWQADEGAPGAEALFIDGSTSAALTLAPQSVIVYVRQGDPQEQA